MDDHSAFAFEPTFLARLERLRLLTRRVPAGGFKGEHRATHLGSGIEFADYRPYVEGDDVRHLDWRAYLRFDRLLLRMFEEHGDLAVYILLDCSRSMAPTPGADGRRKFDAARRLAAALAYIALATLDRVTLAPYSSHAHQVLGPLHGSRQVWRALDFLANLDTGGDTRLDHAVRQVFGAGRRRGLVILISDLLSDTATRRWSTARPATPSASTAPPRCSTGWRTRQTPTERRSAPVALPVAGPSSRRRSRCASRSWPSAPYARVCSAGAASAACLLCLSGCLSCLPLWRCSRST